MHVASRKIKHRYFAFVCSASDMNVCRCEHFLFRNKHRHSSVKQKCITHELHKIQSTIIIQASYL